MIALIFQEGLKAMAIEANGKGRSPVSEKAVCRVTFNIFLLRIIFSKGIPLVGIMTGGACNKSGRGFITSFVI